MQVPALQNAEPLQLASVTQELAQAALEPAQKFWLHSLSGSVPAGMTVQVPTVPARVQDRQVPLQLMSQHTPSLH